jgi:hypothetical protein
MSMTRPKGRVGRTEDRVQITEYGGQREVKGGEGGSAKVQIGAELLCKSGNAKRERKGGPGGAREGTR